MSKEKYNEVIVTSRLEKKGVKFNDGRTFTIPKGRLGLSDLGMVDYLVNHCGKFAKWEA